MVLLRTCFIILFVGISQLNIAQDLSYTHYLINSLTAEFMGGRGYVFKGDKRAADFIKYEFKQDSLVALTPKYLQPFTFSVNTFPKRMSAIVDNETILFPGKDFIVLPASGNAKGRYDLVWINDTMLEVNTGSIKNKAIIIDKSIFSSETSKTRLKAWADDIRGAAGIIYLEPEKLTWSVATHQNKFFGISILKKKFPEKAKHLDLDITAKFVGQHNTQNVAGYIKGLVEDTFIVFTAHYDHLGWMGKDIFFPGANDNASGTSMLLNLARYYSKANHKPKYSILFIAFAGEEAGLKGSHYYTENPLLPLSKIKFLINMDLMGTGDEGMMVVNATEFPEQFKQLEKINNEKQYLPKLGQRGKAANSDHYFFTEKGVPSFFFYTLGGISAYHDIYDRPETLPLTKYKEVFQLIVDFVSTF